MWNVVLFGTKIQPNLYQIVVANTGPRCASPNPVLLLLAPFQNVSGQQYATCTSRNVAAMYTFHPGG
jgi:hypothetical protein